MGKKDYILRGKAIKAVTGWETDPTDEELKMALSNVPSADVVKVSKVRQVLLDEFGAEETEAIDALMERMK